VLVPSGLPAEGRFNCSGWRATGGRFGPPGRPARARPVNSAVTSPSGPSPTA